MKELKKVQRVLDKKGIWWKLGSETGWGDDSLVFDGGDCKILLYVINKDGKMVLSYYDLFEEGEYSPIFDSKIEETTTSFRGTRKSISSMLKDLDLV